jgi:hypothetical protein
MSAVREPGAEAAYSLGNSWFLAAQPLKEHQISRDYSHEASRFVSKVTPKSKLHCLSVRWTLYVISKMKSKF